MTTVALRKKPSYIFIIPIIGIMAAFIGFGKTFFLPLSQGSFNAPLGVHVHGLFTFAWVILSRTFNSIKTQVKATDYEQIQKSSLMDDHSHDLYAVWHF